MGAAVAVDAGVHLVATLGEQPGDDFRCPPFLAGKLRVGVKIAPLPDEMIIVDEREHSYRIVGLAGAARLRCARYDRAGSPAWQCGR